MIRWYDYIVCFLTAHFLIANIKIAFLAPRFHTNQIALVKYLLKSKNQVSFYVTRIGKSEDHSSIKPKIISLN